jgi:hypothetical protein
MKKIALATICAAFAAFLVALPLSAPSEAASVESCKVYAKKRAESKMGGPKSAENAMLMGATGGLAGKSADGKKHFTGFGLGGAAIGLIVYNEKRMKHYKHYYNRCMTRA